MRKILITGCSSGFGEDIVKKLLTDKNNFVIATMRDAESREHTLNNINNDNYKLLSLDITNPNERKNVSDYIRTEMNQELDILINNAGYGLYGALELTSEDDLRKQMEVNFFGTAMMIKEFLPFLRKSGAKNKKIINISSMLGQTGMPLSASYGASKHALEGLVESLQYELAPFGINIMTICPGRHRTKFMQNIKWSSLEDKEGIYNNQTQNLKQLMSKFAKGKEIPLSNVSNRVVKIVYKDNFVARTYIGKDANIFYLLRKLLPFNVLMNFITNTYCKIVQKSSYES